MAVCRAIRYDYHLVFHSLLTTATGEWLRKDSAGLIDLKAPMVRQAPDYLWPMRTPLPTQRGTKSSCNAGRTPAFLSTNLLALTNPEGVRVR